MTEIRRKSLEEYELMKQGFSFKPKINEYKPKIEESREERWTRLLGSKIEKQRKNEQLRVEQEKKEIKETCTFHPEINAEFEVKNQDKITLLSM